MMGFFANGLIFLSSSMDGGAGLRIPNFAWAVPSSSWARRILKDADLEEWILLEDRSSVLLDEVHAPVQAKGGVQSIGDRLVEYDRCCISRRIPSLDD